MRYVPRQAIKVVEDLKKAGQCHVVYSISSKKVLYLFAR